MKYTPYNQIRDSLLTGDQILTSGEGFVSWLIKMITRSWATHAAKVYVAYNNVFVWESTRLGKGVDGVRMTLMSQWIAEYKGKVYLRSLKCVRNDTFYKAYKDTREAFKGKKYEQSIWELMGAAMPWRNKENFKSLFCSELCAEVDMRSGVLPRYNPTLLPANEITPADYLVGKKIDRRMRFNKEPACFGKMIRLK